MGRRVGEMRLMVMEKMATDAVKPMIVSSHTGSRDIAGSSMTLREVIWPIAAKMIEDALTGVKSSKKLV